MLTKTDAIVLKSMKYGDTSKIVTFYTRRFGKIKGIAKGARRKGNKFGSSLEPLSHVELVLYKKEHRDLHLISQCDSIDSFRTVHESVGKMSVGFLVLELTDRLAHDEEENGAFFSALHDTLAELDRSDRNVESLGRSFQIRCAALLGYAPSLESCAECGKKVDEEERASKMGFHPVNGAVVCVSCYKRIRGQQTIGYRALSAPAHRILRRFLFSRIDSIPSIVYSEAVGNEIDETLRLYLRYHFDTLKDLNSTQIFRAIAQ